jgi:hypothetical protein
MTKLSRKGEQGTAPVRSLRYLQKDGYWYYTTREGVDIGPFDSLDDAEMGVAEFIDFIQSSQVQNPSELITFYRAA